MKKYGHFSRFMVPVGLSASFCSASAQADTWVTPGNLRPLYKVEAVSFHCNDETGYDEPWFAPWISDEVRVAVGTPAATTLSKVFGDVDSGETRSFAPDQSCIYPIDEQSPSGHRLVLYPNETWTCSDAGAPGPISFTVVMAEEDSGFFHNYPWGGTFTSPESLPDPNDDLIGRHTVEFTAEQLAFAMPNVGDFIEPVITLGPCYDERGCITSPGTPNDAEYTFTYRVTRLPLQLQGPVMSDRAAQMAVPTR